jgi:energy-coupling factor transporter ATP-binding protein EcfA2
MIEIRDLSFRYGGASTYAPGPPAIENVTLLVPQGQYLLLCGPTGSGKSTLCRALNGLVPHFHPGEFVGQVQVGGLNTRDHRVNTLFQQVGVVFQNPESQLFSSTVEREIAFGLESLGLDSAEINQRTIWAANLMGIVPLMARVPQSLSGGEKQRVAVTAALALRPMVMVLDEPFAHLDPEGASQLRAALRAVHSLGTTVILAEHRLHDVVADADRLLVMHEGRIALDGPPREVLASEVVQYGLNLPLSVRLFRDLDRSEVPLTVEEAADLLTRAGDDVSWPEGPERLSVDRDHSPPGGTKAIEAKEVAYAFGAQTVLSETSLTVDEGEMVALVGANGSGKTTLIKHFNGLLRPQRGWVNVLGSDTRQTTVADLARRVGLVFQNPSHQFFRYTVAEEIAVGPRVLGRQDPEWLERLYDLFALRPLLDRSPYWLSEGEKKRVAFASALATRPRILALDEPTVGQDQRFRDELGRLLKSLQAEGHTFVLVTHDMEFAEAHADRWIVLAQGRVVAEGTPETLMDDRQAMTQAALQPTERVRFIRAMGDGRHSTLRLTG